MKITVLTTLVQNKKPEKKWLYETQGDMLYRVEGVELRDCDVSSFGHPIGKVRDNVVTIFSKYAHDGMTLFPDSELNAPAGILHDFGYQSGLWSRLLCDQMIRAVMEFTGARARHIVYAGVRAAGWKFYAKEPGIEITYL